MRIAVVMPAHNEDQTIARVITHIRRVLPDCQVVVVDDLSQDRTAHEARAAGAKVLRLANNLGYGGAVQTGFRLAEEHPGDTWGTRVTEQRFVLDLG